MTKETLNHVNNLARSISDLEGISEHINALHCMIITFEWSGCLQSRKEFICPDWLVGVIKNAIKTKKTELEQELEAL